MKYNPLHSRRFDILADLKRIPVQTGDIFYRRGDARGPLGLPFSTMVCHLTCSKFSHAAMLFMQNGEPFMLDINETGTQQLRFIDWVDSCITTDMRVVRLKGITPEKIQIIDQKIKEILDADPDYDYTFDSPDKFYCTESVNYLAESVGLPICEPELVKHIIPWWVYPIFWLGSKIYKVISGAGIPLDRKYYYIGNERRGMMASTATEVIYQI